MTTDTLRDDLAYIKNIVEQSRRNLCLSGVHLVVWGILVSIALIVSWILALYGIGGLTEWIHWGLVIAGGWLFELIYHRQVNRKRPVRTYAEKVDGYLWLAIGISLMITGFIGVFTNAIEVQYLSPIISLILAIGYFGSGVIYDVPWLRNLAFGWWGGAVIMFLFPGPFHLLIMAGMMIAFQTIPGFIISRTWGK